MGGDVIATGVSDPDFYTRQASRLAGAVSSIVGGYRARQEEQAQREQEEIDRAWRAMQAAPEMADTWGQALIRKYGSKYPEVPAMVSAIQNRHTLAREIPEAGSAWEAAIAKREQDHAEALRRANALPDLAEGYDFNQPFGQIGPNVEKLKELARLKAVDPSYFPAEALGDLAPHQRSAARIYAKERGVPLHEKASFDTYSDLAPTQKGLEAVRAGLIPGDSETAESLRAAAGLETKAADLQKQGFQRQERLGRQEFTGQRAEQNDAAIRERMELGAKIAEARQNRAQANQKELIGMREGLRRSRSDGSSSGSGLSAKDIVQGSKMSAREYDAALSQAAAGLTGIDRQDAVQQFQKAHGARPHLITPYAAKKIVELGEDDDDAMEMARQLTDAVGQGHTEADVLKVFKEHAPAAAKPSKGAAGVKGAAGKPVGKPKQATPAEIEQARAALKAKYPRKSPAEIEALVNQFKAHVAGNG